MTQSKVNPVNEAVKMMSDFYKSDAVSFINHLRNELGYSETQIAKILDLSIPGLQKKYGRKGVK